MNAADLRQIIATARQLLLDGEVEDAIAILDADDAAPPERAPVTRYEREILVAEIERLTRERDEARWAATEHNQVMSAYVRVPSYASDSTGPTWPVRTADGEDLTR